MQNEITLLDFGAGAGLPADLQVYNCRLIRLFPHSAAIDAVSMGTTSINIPGC